MGWVLFLLSLTDQPAIPRHPAFPSTLRQNSLAQMVPGVPRPGQPIGYQEAARLVPSVTDAPPLPSPLDTSTAVPPRQPAAPVAQQAMPAMDRDESSGLPAMQFRGFSDVSYHVDNQNGTANSFSLGQFNLFITSKLSDKLSVLAEAVVEADQQNTVGIDLERLLFRWASSDYLNVSVGRYHTAIGWYNTAYHHSSWMQTAVGRPFLFAFEDGGGILPVHNVGISLSGRIPGGELGLRYIAEVGNGRASRNRSAEAVQNVVDENSGKAVNLALVSRPARLPGLEAGVSLYHDRLTPDGKPNVGETILAGHVVYQTTQVEWLNELVVIRHAAEGTGPVSHTTGFYTQLSKKFGAWRPYARYQSVNAPSDDPVFPDVGLQRGPSVGLRYDVHDSVALKFQYDRTERRGLAGYNGFATQLSFTF
ncbi:MAG: hypothetical protein WCP29_17035 [Acidobacteriota bacterium]